MGLWDRAKTGTKLREKIEQMKLDAGEIHGMLCTPAGQKLMRELERTFIVGDLMGDSIEATMFNLGARELALKLVKLRDYQPPTGG
jgi:hypothetical protein